MSQPHVPTCPHLSPKPTPCPSPVAPSITLKVSFDPAGPLNPPHVPAPCPHLSPKPTPCPSPVVLPQMSHSTTLVPKTHPMSQPHAPTCPLVPKCYPKGLIPPCWSPKPIPCPSPVSPSVTKVSFHHAGPLNPPHVPAPFPTRPLNPPHVPAHAGPLNPPHAAAPSPTRPLNRPHVPAPYPQVLR